MAYEMKNMAYWKAKNGIPGIDKNSETKNLADGRSPSSAFQQQTSPVGELLGVLQESAEGKGPSGTIDVLGGEKRDKTAGELASERYMTKTIQKNIPEKHRADMNYRLARGRAEGESYEDQAQAMHKSMSPTKQTDQKKKDSSNKKTPSNEKRSEMSKKGLAYNPNTGGWMKVWKDDKQ